MPAAIAPREVAIVAAGVISPLGHGMSETLDSLRAARDCVSAVTRFDVSKCRSSTAGQVSDETLAEAAKSARTSRTDKRLHRASRMMIAAARELAAQDRGF